MVLPRGARRFIAAKLEAGPVPCSSWPMRLNAAAYSSAPPYMSIISAVSAATARAALKRRAALLPPPPPPPESAQNAAARTPFLTLAKFSARWALLPDEDATGLMPRDTSHASTYHRHHRCNRCR